MMHNMATVKRSFEKYILPIPLSIEKFTHFLRFAWLLDLADTIHWLKNVIMNVIKTFCHWYLESHNVKSLNDFLVKL